MQKIIYQACCWLALFFLTSCGFHLRSSPPLSPMLHYLYLQTPDPNGILARELAESLKLSGVELSETPNQADSILCILHQDSGQQLLSVGGTQQTRQYNLTLSVSFQINTPDGRTLLPPQTVTSMQPITLQADQILAGSNEQNNIYLQMQRTLVYSIVSRLASPEVDKALTKKP